MNKISIIAAIGENRELGKNGKLLWHISEDLKRFKKLTDGHIVIMGRKTYDSIPLKWRPLSNRANIVITRNENYKAEGVIIVHSVEDALKEAQNEKIQKKYPGEIFIIGGGQIYEQGIKYADKLYLTVVKGKYEADVFFPEYPEFKKIIYKKDVKDDHYQYSFLELII